MPTDMRALQDFEEEDKLQIKMNDVITIIEGRSVIQLAVTHHVLVGQCHNAPAKFFSTRPFFLQDKKVTLVCVHAERRSVIQDNRCIFC